MRAARDNGGTPTRDDVQRLRAEASPSTAMEAALEDAEEEENEHDEEESAEEEENDEESDEEDEDDDHDEDDGKVSLDGNYTDGNADGKIEAKAVRNADGSRYAHRVTSECVIRMA